MKILRFFINTYFMKQIILSLAIVLFCFPCSYSQNNQGNIAISVGPSFPIGDFASKDIKDNASGLAKTGAAVTISYSRLSGKQLGISVDLHGQQNPLNISSMEKSFSETGISQGFWTVSDPNQPIPPGPYSVYPNWKFKKRSWLMGSLLLGGYGQFPLTQKGSISFIPKAMIGVIHVSAPRISGSSITDTATAYIEQSGSKAFGFTYSLSGGLKYDCGKKIFFLMNLGYTGTNNIRFKDITASITTTKGVFGSPDYSVQQAVVTGEGRQTISALNLLVGLGLRL